MVGGGVIVGIALGLGSSGILGDTLAGGLRVMLGPVAWVVPALLVIGAMIIWAIPMKGSRPRATP